MTAKTSETLTDGWTFSQVSSPNWQDVEENWTQCTIPTSVHAELRKSGRIDDPYEDLNEWDVQWVQEADWEFKTTFTLSSVQRAQPHVDLIFYGLDTYCTITLNGHTIAKTENMFLAHRIPCNEFLKQDNKLVLHFASPWHAARISEEQNGGPRPLWNGASNRLYSRKAQYGWGWDWGPIIMTVGPWKPVHVECYNARLEDIRIDTTLTGHSCDEASLQAQFKIGGTGDEEEHMLDIQLKREGSDGTIRSVESYDAQGKLQWTFDIGEVEGWYPRGYGQQPLYKLEVELKNKSGQSLDRISRRIAFRSARLIQEPLKGENEQGTSFVFEINGIRVFCAGSNWIPCDSLLTEVETGRYGKWVELLVKGNQNMLRVWGGGVYENEELYNACDEKGVLVWQDFMFGCGIYPSYPQFNENVKSEAEQVVTRLRDHPSVVIFAGNNEDYTLAESIGLMDYNDQSGDYMRSKFPARHIYEILLPEIVGRLSTVMYHRGSPYGGKDSNDPTVGDIHQWNVWHGTQEPWSNWDKLAGRFVSEFGMQGWPNRRTVDQWSDDKKQLFPQSRVSATHNKATGFERRLALYLTENLRYSFDTPSYIYYTQIMQADCLSTAYRLWRRNWKGYGKEYTAGALVWQLNDCWPCVSWSVVDYYLRPKPAFFAIARELRPYTVGISRKDVKVMRDKDTQAFYEIRQVIEVWSCNSTLVEEDVTVELETYDLANDQRSQLIFQVQLAANASTDIWTGQMPTEEARTSEGQPPLPIVVQARIYRDVNQLSYSEDRTPIFRIETDTSGKELLARHCNWPEPYKYIDFPSPNLRIQTHDDEVRLTVDKPLKGLVLEVEGDAGDECEWSDQAIDVYPGDEQVIHAKGLNGRKFNARYIGDGTA